MRILVIGTGSIGTRHLKLLNAIPDLRPLALPSRAERLAELISAGFAVCETIPAANTLGVRQAIIATDTSRHRDDAQAAIEAGFDILVEKPLASNALIARSICIRAKEADKQIFVGCNMRFNEALNDFRAKIYLLGNIHTVRIECQSYLPDWRPSRPYNEAYSARKEEGGVLRDLIHEIDYAGWLFGWPKKIQANVKNLGRLGIESEEMADILWEIENGPTVSIHLDYLSQPARRMMRAYGENGTLEWDGVCGATTLLLTGNSPQRKDSLQTRNEMYLTQDLAFIQTLNGQLDPRLATGEEGIKALCVCDACRSASEAHCETEIQYL